MQQCVFNDTVLYLEENHLWTAVASTRTDTRRTAKHTQTPKHTPSDRPSSPAERSKAIDVDQKWQLIYGRSTWPYGCTSTALHCTNIKFNLLLTKVNLTLLPLKLFVEKTEKMARRRPGVGGIKKDSRVKVGSELILIASNKLQLHNLFFDR